MEFMSEFDDLYPFAELPLEVKERNQAISFSKKFFEGGREHGVLSQDGFFGEERRLRIRPRENEEEEEEEDAEKKKEKEVVIGRSQIMEEEMMKNIQEAIEHETSDPSLFNISNYSCRCSQNCVSKFERKKFILLVHSLRKMHPLTLKRFVAYSLLPLFAHPEDEDVINPLSKGPQKKKRRRKGGDSIKRRSHVTYILGCVKICREAYCRVVGMTPRVLDDIIQTISKGGGYVPEFVERRGGTRDYTTQKRESIMRFLRRYGECFGYPCASIHPDWRLAASDREIVFLPSKTERMFVYDCFVKYLTPCDRMDQERDHNDDELDADSNADGDGDGVIDCARKRSIHAMSEHGFVSYSHFIRTWKAHSRWLKIAKTDTGFCDTCSEILGKGFDGFDVLFEAHMRLAHRERLFYRECLQRSIECAEDTIHLSFGFSTGFRIPFNRNQFSTFFSNTPFKIDMFGISCESRKENIIYCIPEGTCPGDHPRGIECVIGMIHEYLSNRCPPAVRHLVLHADNSLMQFGNNVFVGYLAYLVATGRFSSIKLVFMLSGHSMNAVDGAFSLLRRRCDEAETIETIPDLLDAVTQSSMRNVPVLTDEFVWHEWKSFLSQFELASSELGSMMHQHIYEFSHEDPFVVDTYRWSLDVGDASKKTSFFIFTTPAGRVALVSPACCNLKEREEFVVQNPFPREHRMEEILKCVDENCGADAKEWWNRRLLHRKSDSSSSSSVLQK
jgi:hypothetical protein